MRAIHLELRISSHAKEKYNSSTALRAFTFARCHAITVEKARRIFEAHGIARVASDVAAREVAHSNRAADHSAADLKP